MCETARYYMWFLICMYTFAGFFICVYRFTYTCRIERTRAKKNILHEKEKDMKHIKKTISIYMCILILTFECCCTFTPLVANFLSLSLSLSLSLHVCACVYIVCFHFRFCFHFFFLHFISILSLSLVPQCAPHTLRIPFSFCPSLSIRISIHT